MGLFFSNSLLKRSREFQHYLAGRKYVHSPSLCTNIYPQILSRQGGCDDHTVTQTLWPCQCSASAGGKGDSGRLELTPHQKVVPGAGTMGSHPHSALCSWSAKLTLFPCSSLGMLLSRSHPLLKGAGGDPALRKHLGGPSDVWWAGRWREGGI